MTRKQALEYLKLTKPGVLFGNVLTTVAGFLFASTNGFATWRFLATILGTTLVIAAACCLNNYLDQDIDAKMARTKDRPLIRGSVSARGALILCFVLLVGGLFVLLRYTPILVFGLELFGFVTYVWLYGALSKRRSVHGTLVGSVSGAIPIVAGYVAATGSLDINALLLFLIIFFWQEPEFYSIAIYRQKEYRAANIPVISVVHGIKRTINEIFIYTVLFVLCTLLLAIVGSAGYIYLAIMTVVGVYWIWLGIKGFTAKNSDLWAKRMFHSAINILVLFCLLISLNPWLY